MQQYRFKVIETLSKEVEIEAEGYYSAYDKLEEMIDSEEIVLTADDFESREIYP